MAVNKEKLQLSKGRPTWCNICLRNLLPLSSGTDAIYVWGTYCLYLQELMEYMFEKPTASIFRNWCNICLRNLLPLSSGTDAIYVWGTYCLYLQEPLRRKKMCLKHRTSHRSYSLQYLLWTGPRAPPFTRLRLNSVSHSNAYSTTKQS